MLDSCTRILRGGDYEVATASDGTRGAGAAGGDPAGPGVRRPQDAGHLGLRRAGAGPRRWIRRSSPSSSPAMPPSSSAVSSHEAGRLRLPAKPFTPDEFRLITSRGLEKRRLVLETIGLAAGERGAAGALRGHRVPRAEVAAGRRAAEPVRADAGLGGPADRRRAPAPGADEDQDRRPGEAHSHLAAGDFRGHRPRSGRASSPSKWRMLVAKAVESVEPHAVRKDIAHPDRPSPSPCRPWRATRSRWWRRW